MQTSWYNSGIRIIGAEGKNVKVAAAMSNDAGQKFIDSIQKALDELALLPSGSELLNEIRDSGKKCTIFSSDALYKSAGPVAHMDPQTVIADSMRRIKPFRAPKSGYAKALAKAKASLPSIPKPVVPSPTHLAPPKVNIKRAPGMPDMSNADEYSKELHRIINASKMPRSMVSKLIGVSLGELTRMEEGSLQMENDAYIKFAMLFYNLLQSGGGTNASVRFVSLEPEEPDFLTLGHELIHAWRMMKGMRISDDNQRSWEEEAMTTGIPPFSSMKFTENKLRSQVQGSPLRRSYPGAIAMSTMAQGINLKCQVRKEDN